MELLKETKYLQFIIKEYKPKTKVIAVVNKTHQEEIGVLRWYAQWRQYCFFPHHNTIWNKNCLNDVNEMITELTPVRPKPRQKYMNKIIVIGVIAYSINDFIFWGNEKKHNSSKKVGVRNTQRDYVYKNTRYVCISQPQHPCGYLFDKIIKTNRAKSNKNYDQILDSVQERIVSIRR